MTSKQLPAHIAAPSPSWWNVFPETVSWKEIFPPLSGLLPRYFVIRTRKVTIIHHLHLSLDEGTIPTAVIIFLSNTIFTWITEKALAWEMAGWAGAYLFIQLSRKHQSLRLCLPSCLEKPSDPKPISRFLSLTLDMSLRSCQWSIFEGEDTDLCESCEPHFNYLFFYWASFRLWE